MAEEMSRHVLPAAELQALMANQRLQIAEMRSVLRQSLARDDRGVGKVWTPADISSGRPTAIFARGVTSVYTAAIEMQALHDANSRTRSAVAHFVFSLSTEESQTIGNDKFIRAVVETLDKMRTPDGLDAGWSKHPLLAVIHEDTLEWGPPDEYGIRRLIAGNKHCHVMVANVNPETMLAFDRTQENVRLNFSTKERELEHGMQHDWGLCAVRDEGLPGQRVERSKSVDWAARRQAQEIDRAERQASNFLSDVTGLATARDWEDRIHYQLRKYLNGCRDRNEMPLMSDVHVIANRLSLQVEGVIDGHLTFRLMERANPEEKRKTWVDYYGDTRHIAARWKPTSTLITLDEKRVAKSPLEREGRKSKKPPHAWLQAKHEEALEARKWLLNVGTLEAAEEEYLRVISDDPGRVARDYVNGYGRAIFMFDDYESLVSRHVTKDWTGVAERALRADPAIRIVRNPDEAALSRGDVAELRPFSESNLYTGVDGQAPLFTIVSQRDKAEKLDRLVRQALAILDPDFNQDALDKAIRQVLAKERETNPSFDFDKEQYQALAGYNRALTIIEGPPGAGKTSLAQVHKIYADLTGREIRGFTAAQKPASVLVAEGIESMNQLRAEARAAREGRSLLTPGSRFIVDEVSTADMDSAITFIETMIAQRATGAMTGGLDQLQGVKAGNPFGIICRAAIEMQEEAGGHAFTRLKHVYRQQSDELEFMRKKTVRKMSKAINTAWKVGMADCLEDYRHLVVEHATRELEIKAIAEDIVWAMKEGMDVLSPGPSYEDCLYVSRHVRRELGLEKPEGQRIEFVFDRSTLELSVGEHIIFKENRGTDPNDTYKNGKPKLYVENGDVGVITAMERDLTTGRWGITVKLDNGRTIEFNPDNYSHVSYAYSSTIFANQGSKGRVVIGSILPSSQAREIQVTFSRATHILRIHTHLKWEKIVETLTSDRSMEGAFDSLLFQAVIKRTGGATSPWARAVARAMDNAADPLSLQHAAAMIENRKLLQADIREILNQNLAPRDLDRAIKECAERRPYRSKVAWCAGRVPEISANEIVREHRLEMERSLTQAAERIEASNHVEKLEVSVPRAPAERIAELEAFIAQPGSSLEQDRAKARALDEIICLEKRQRLDAAEEARHARNVAAARASIVPLTGTPGEAYLRGRAITKFDETYYCANWGAGFEVNDTNPDGSPKLSRGHGPAIVCEFFDPVTRASLGFQGRYLNPPTLSDGNVLRQFNAGPAKRGVFATKGAWDSKVVAITEGFTDQLSLLTVGMEAFGCAGTGNVPDTLPQAVNGRKVLIASDRDPNNAGDEMAEKLKTQLEPTGSITRRLQVPWHDRTKKVDVNDALRRGELEAAIDRALEISPLLRESRKRYERSLAIEERMIKGPELSL